MRRTKRKVFAGIAFAAVLGLSLAACDNTAPTSQAQKDNQTLSNKIENSATHAVPYPLSEMQTSGWTEERELREHLLRQTDPNAVRYIAWLTLNGQVIEQWPIKGMVFDPNSSMTETTDIVCNTGSTDSAYACGTVNSPGDNGTYGPEAGAVAFFTTSNVEVQLPASALWVEADAPLNITTQPLITYNVGTPPSVNHGGLAGIGGH